MGLVGLVGLVVMVLVVCGGGTYREYGTSYRGQYIYDFVFNKSINGKEMERKRQMS